MNSPDLIKTFVAEAAIVKHRLVVFGTSDANVVQASAATDALVGVADTLDAGAGERLDVVLTGVAEVEFGGTVSRGDLLTADVDGKAVVAAPAVGVNNRVAGVAMVSGVAGDVGAVLLMPTQIQG